MFLSASAKVNKKPFLVDTGPPARDDKEDDRENADATDWGPFL
jgi:hypothetical protein